MGLKVHKRDGIKVSPVLVDITTSGTLVPRNIILSKIPIYFMAEAEEVKAMQGGGGGLEERKLLTPPDLLYPSAVYSRRCRNNKLTTNGGNSTIWVTQAEVGSGWVYTWRWRSGERGRPGKQRLPGGRYPEVGRGGEDASIINLSGSNRKKKPLAERWI